MRGKISRTDPPMRPPTDVIERCDDAPGSDSLSPHLFRSSSRRARHARGEKGFTLIELMVVIAIIGILVSMAVPTYRTIVVRAKETVLKQNLATLRDVIDQYYADKGKYPDSLETLASAGYLRHLPVDPMTEQANWVTVPYTGAEEGQLEPTEGQDTGGIWDVHSASEEISQDGSKYSDW
jgi:general secretion pathway protein G